MLLLFRCLYSGNRMLSFIFIIPYVFPKFNQKKPDLAAAAKKHKQAAQPALYSLYLIFCFTYKHDPAADAANAPQTEQTDR